MTDPTPTPQPLDLDAIRARADAASPGEWQVLYSGPDYERGAEPYPIELHGPANAAVGNLNREEQERLGHRISEISDLSEADAEFIASARDDVPALLAKVERLTTERDGLAAVIEQAPHANYSDDTYCAVYAGEDCDCWKSAAPSDVLAEVKREAAAQALAPVQRLADSWKRHGVVPDAWIAVNVAIREGRS